MRQSLRQFLFVIALLSEPCITRRLHRRANAKAKANSTVSVDPILGTAIGAVAVAGSLYSLYKTRRLIAQNERDQKVASQIVKEYRETAKGGCQALLQVDEQLSKQIGAIKKLLEKDTSGSQLVLACKEESKVLALQTDLQQRLANSCEHAPPSLKSTCESRAAETHVQTLCASSASEKTLEQNILKLNLARVRLDGLLTGLCDKVTGSLRMAPKLTVDSILQSVEGQSSLLQERSGSQKTMIVDWIGIIGLAFSAIGCTDFAYDLYDTSVNANQGYAVLLDFAKEEVDAQKKIMCQSLSHFWLQAVKVTAWTSALMGTQFVEAGITSRSPRSREMTMLNWNLILDGGSHWICDHLKDCLVPAESANVQESNRIGYHYPPDQRFCKLHGATYYRVCGETDFQADQESMHQYAPVMQPSGTVTAIAPEACFTARFGGHKKHKNAWIMTFGKGNTPTYEQVMGAKYDKVACDNPFDELVQAELAVSSIQTELQRNCN